MYHDVSMYPLIKAFYPRFTHETWNNSEQEQVKVIAVVHYESQITVTVTQSQQI